MPRISHPKITKGQAIACLLHLYRNEPAFMKELKQLRQPYLEILKELAEAWIIFWAKCAWVLRPDEFQKFSMDYLEGNEQFAKLPPEFTGYINQVQQKGNKLQPYADKLAELAPKWKLKAPWAVPMLIFFDMADILREFGMPAEFDIPLESLDFLYPFPPPSPALEIKVSSWAFVFYDKRQIMSQIGRKLTEYGNKLKGEGLTERPSAMEKHARWWFDHYVHKKSFETLADMEVRGESSIAVVYASTIGKAVRKFSKLIGIALKL
jgi:hypothetical protein